MFSAHLAEVEAEAEEPQLSESQLSAEERRLARILNRPAKVQSYSTTCTMYMYSDCVACAVLLVLCCFALLFV